MLELSKYIYVYSDLSEAPMSCILILFRAMRQKTQYWHTKCAMLGSCDVSIILYHVPRVAQIIMRIYAIYLSSKHALLLSVAEQPQAMRISATCQSFPATGTEISFRAVHFCRCPPQVRGERRQPTARGGAHKIS